MNVPIYASTSGSSDQKDFQLCPPGAQQAVCCDVIDLGLQPDSFRGRKPRMVHKVRIRWQSEFKLPDGRPFMVQKRYTLSLGERATLRKDLEAWRGKKFEPADLDNNRFDVEKLIGVNCYVNVIHQDKGQKGMYAEVVGLMPFPRNKPQLTVTAYVRVKDRPKDQQREPGEDDDAGHDDHGTAAPAPPADDKPPF